MKKMLRYLLLILAMLILAVVLFVTGKRHEIYILNNTKNEVKYSINGEDYKLIRANKKIKTLAKGVGNYIYFKNSVGKVIRKDLDLGISKNIEIKVNKIYDNSVEWYKEIEE